MERYEIGLPLYSDSEKRLNNLLLQSTVTSVDTVAAEVERSTKIHGDFQSMHEGYAVFLEEQDELWEEIKRKEILPNQLKKEAVHTAAMAFKLLQFIERTYGV